MSLRIARQKVNLGAWSNKALDLLLEIIDVGDWAIALNSARIRAPHRALDAADEGLSHSIALRTFDGCRSRVLICVVGALGFRRGLLRDASRRMKVRRQPSGYCPQNVRRRPRAAVEAPRELWIVRARKQRRHLIELMLGLVEKSTVEQCCADGAVRDAYSAKRGEGCAIIISPGRFGSFCAYEIFCVQRGCGQNPGRPSPLQSEESAEQRVALRCPAD